jgi:flavin-dependent dehydrogenase
LSRTFDTVIFGGGVAGLAAAITLNRRGQRVAVIERETARPVLGESLSAMANPLLAELGVWDRFLGDGHVHCHAVKSAWGDSNIAIYDFLNTPHGHAWRIDRAIFEQRLSEAATGLGMPRIAWQRPMTVHRVQGAWHLDLRGNRTVSASFLVDATGRAAALARRCGAQRLALDRQVAVVGLFPPSAAPADPSLLVEAAPDGWWYSATLPDGRLAAVLLTDLDLHPPSTFRNGREWMRMLAQTRHIRARIAGGACRLDVRPQVVAAGSGRLDRAAGDGWLTVGDAAMTYDPLSGHGLVAALASARDAAAAIDAYAGGDTEALAAYDARVSEAFVMYSARRRASYASELRWQAAPYWRRRQRSNPRTPLRALDGVGSPQPPYP